MLTWFESSPDTGPRRSETTPEMAPQNPGVATAAGACGCQSMTTKATCVVANASIAAHVTVVHVTAAHVTVVHVTADLVTAVGAI